MSRFDPFKRAVDEVAEAAGKGSGRTSKASDYIDVGREEADFHSHIYANYANDGYLKGRKSGERLSNFMGHAGGNLEAAAVKEGKSVLGMAGGHAIRGAVWGGAIGGTSEAMQGGSFWDGAKSGAFKGAAGWTGLRMGMKATGASSINPFAGKNKGMFSAGKNMWQATGGKDAKVSGQAVAIMNQRQRDGLARHLLNQRKNSSTKPITGIEL